MDGVLLMFQTPEQLFGVDRTDLMLDVTVCLSSAAKACWGKS